MLAFIQLPPELISNILSFVDPEDLAQVNLSCKYLYHTVKENTALYRAIYLRHLDDPGTADLDWMQEIRDLLKLRAICSSDRSDKEQHLRFVYETTTRLLSRSSSQGARSRLSVSYLASRNTHVLRECFASPTAVDSFLCRSFLFQRAKAPARVFPFPKEPPSEERQMSAKLHCLYGDMVLNWSRTRASRTYPFAASKVYDIRECTPRTRWGPFMDEGPGPRGSESNEEGQLGVPTDRVDWEKVEAIMIVLWYNMKNKELDRLPVFEQFWGVPFAGCWPNSYIPMPANRELTDLELEDPYDITGTWLRVVCFLDYNDFFTYNFPPHDDLPDHLPRPIIDEIEATRLIIMKIHVTKIEPPGPEDGQALPVVHFEGLSRSLDSSWDDNANSDLRATRLTLRTLGSVRLTREGEVRWTSHSIFQGEARWRSECVQLGGIRSSKVVGNWFDKDYDPSGPCGPTAYWKIGDRHPSDNADNRGRGILYHYSFLSLWRQGEVQNLIGATEITVHDYLPIVDGYKSEDRIRNHNADENETILPLQIYSDDDDDEDEEENEHDDVEDEEADDEHNDDDDDNGESEASTLEEQDERGEVDAGEPREVAGIEGSGTSLLIAVELEGDEDDSPYIPSKLSSS